MGLLIERIVIGPLQTNCYIISCEISGNSFIIDPGDEAVKISNFIRRNEFIPKGILLTHAHSDHIGGVKIIRNGFNVPLMAHPDDVNRLISANLDPIDRYLVDGEFLNLGQESILVIHTPGHSPGSVCLYRKPFLFSGDTLFKEGIGRTDLPGGSYEQIENSIRNKLFSLPDDTIVYPGHGPETTIGDEK